VNHRYDRGDLADAGPEGHMRTERVRSAVLVLVPLGLSGLSFGGITGNYFLADDFLHLFRLANDGWRHFVWQVYFGHLMLARNAMFALHHAIFGVAPAGYFATVLATHLLNVLLLFVLIRRLTGSGALACLGATLWGTMPANEGTLGWYSVYGQVMATTTLLAVLVLVTGRASRDEPLTAYSAALCGCLLFIGAASFATGLAAAIAFPAIAILLWPAVRCRRGGIIGMLAIPLAIGLIYAAVWMSAPKMPGDELLEGEMLQVGVREIALSLGMVWHLLGAGLANLVLGLAHPAPSYPELVTLLGGGLLLLASIVRLRGARAVDPRKLGAAMLIPASCYALIVVGRAHLIIAFHEYGIPLRTVAGVARYHYMAATGLTLWLCLLAAAMFEGWSARREWLLAAAVVAIGVPLCWARGATVDHHEQSRHDVEEAVARLATAVAAQSPGSTVCLPNHALPPIAYFPKPLGFPGDAAVFIIYLDGTDAVRDRRVLFAEEDPAVLVQMRAGTRLARLLVTQCPRLDTAGQQRG
jgi:hypothetical protein